MQIRSFLKLYVVDNLDSLQEDGGCLSSANARRRDCVATAASL